VLKIIAEQSRCSEPKLFIVAANRRLERFGDGSLGGLRKRLGQCVKELQARGLVEVNGDQLVRTPAGSVEDEDILDLTAELELHPPSKLDEVPTNQKQANLDLAWQEPRTDTLQTQAQVTGATESAPEPTREEIIAAPAGSVEDEDILDLTAELELHPPSKLDEVPTNQKQANLDHAWQEPRTDTLQTQAQVTGGTESAPEPTREEIIAAAAGSVEDEDILDLMAELELHPPSKLDEVPTNKKQANLDHAWQEPSTDTLQTQAQVTGGTESAPKPTREEIIAAMRRFISDD
jgi:hypothetical protein